MALAAPSQPDSAGRRADPRLIFNVGNLAWTHGPKQNLLIVYADAVAWTP